ncbi:CRTAC1 family protein [Alienimonas chondri]|uniref:CRTAC1 family protein n=1 Tax=Alienimonas chondri TaxID=2681879 RepID=UPI001489DE43|nr:CRTAC1 family protein [Alienimonas chondri]
MQRSRLPPPLLLLTLALCLPGCGERATQRPVPAVETPRPVPPSDTQPGSPAFADVTSDVGLSFTRFDGRLPDGNGRIAGGRRMHEWTGGGVVAFDYDLDGRPDLLFTQGCEWSAEGVPPSSEPDPAAERRGRLFRNVDGERFEDVTDASGLALTGYGQGIAAGDYNADGFPDLFVCNVGANRLWRNEGDGTFADVTEEAGFTPHPDGTDWTVSAAIADLNADGLPDIYEANYLTGRDVYTKICRTGDDPPRTCSPNGFPAAADRVWLNLGTGRFAEVADLADLPAPGPGLGVLVTDLDGRPGNEVYVANDQRPNHLLRRTNAGPGGTPRFRDVGAASGAATSGEGESEAGMGIASADLNADGRPDLFVTNFEGESNTLYRSSDDSGPLIYEDATRQTGLFEPSYETLGFGTAFLDMDADGDEDLIYVNGHIDDFTHRGSPLFMRPAMLENVGGRFEPIPSHVAGSFFAAPALGRGLARVDWNGDGRDEVVATHLNGPAVLLRNVSTEGETVSLRLVGTTDNRDAVGAAVTVTAPTADGVPSGPRTKWITAGDGYMSGDEKQLSFGLGATPPGAMLDVVVRWPGGATEQFKGMTADGRFLLVQGAGTGNVLLGHLSSDPGN